MYSIPVARNPRKRNPFRYSNTGIMVLLHKEGKPKEGLTFCGKKRGKAERGIDVFVALKVGKPRGIDVFVVLKVGKPREGLTFLW
jgi:hypothetical protein